MITKTHLRSVVVPAWSAQPQHPMKSLQSLFLLPQRNRETNQQCPVMANFARVMRASLVDQLAHVLQGWEESGDTGDWPQTQGYALLPEERLTSLPCITQHLPLAPNQHLCLKCPQITDQEKNRQRECARRKQNLWPDQVLCAFSFGKKKWSSKIQWRFSILHTSEHGQAEIICSWARTNPWGTLKLYHTLHRLQNVRKSTATPNPQQHRCCVSLRSTCGIDCSLPNLCTFNRTLSALIHSSRKPHCSSSQSQSLLGRCCTALHADQWVGMSSTGIKIDSCFPSLCTN